MIHGVGFKWEDVSEHETPPQVQAGQASGGFHGKGRVLQQNLHQRDLFEKRNRIRRLGTSCPHENAAEPGRLFDRTLRQGNDTQEYNSTFFFIVLLSFLDVYAAMMYINAKKAEKPELFKSYGIMIVIIGWVFNTYFK